MRKQLYIVLAFLLGTPALYAQDVFETKFNQIESADFLPEELRSGKTVVFIDMPVYSDKEWKRVTRSFHTEIIRAGIDPVVYYPMHIPFAGTDITRSFFLDFRKRDITNLILLQYNATESRVAITSLTSEILLSGTPQKGWKMKGVLKDVARQIYVSTANSGYARSNFLINENPERGFMASPFTGSRIDKYSNNLSQRKLAIPYQGISVLDSTMKRLIQQHYPFPHEFVDPSIPEPELESQGFFYILCEVHAPLQDVRDLLEYEREEGVTDYLTVRKRQGKTEAIPLKLREVVHKFYVKELDEGDIFLGNVWDADINRADALLNYLNNHKEQSGL